VNQYGLGKGGKERGSGTGNIEGERGEARNPRPSREGVRWTISWKAARVAREEEGGREGRRGLARGRRRPGMKEKEEIGQVLGIEGKRVRLLREREQMDEREVGGGGAGAIEWSGSRMKGKTEDKGRGWKDEGRGENWARGRYEQTLALSGGAAEFR